MPTFYQHQLDPLGTNPNNWVSNEIASGAGSPNRIIKPDYGPFYADTAVVVDTVTNQPLVKGTDYDCVGLLQEATIKFRKPITDFILLKRTGISNPVHISYGALGGLYENSSSTLATVWNSFVNDSRPVDYVTGINNKPFEFPPSLHPTLFKDVSNFEPLITSLERMTQAILLSNVPAYQNIADYITSTVPEIVTTAEIDQSIPVQKTVTFDRLLYSLDKLNHGAVWIDASSYKVENESTVHMTVRAAGLDPSIPMFWNIEHTTTNNEDFTTTSGALYLVSGVQSFDIQLTGSTVLENTEYFKVVVRKNSVNGPVMAKSYPITIAGYDPEDHVEIFNTCCMYSVDNDINPTSMYILGSQTFSFHQN